MRKSSKKFDYGQGKYYFTIKTTPNNITMYRESKKEAQQVFKKYYNLGKQVEWLGKWEGKKFVETTPPVKNDSGS